MTDADVFVDPRRRRARPASQGVHRDDEADMTTEEERRDPAPVRRRASRRASARRIVLRFLVSPRRDRRRRAGSRASASCATSSCEADDGSLRARPTGERGDDPCGLVFRSDRLPRRRARGRALRRRARGHPQRPGPRADRGGRRAAPRRVRRRLDQARAERDHRHEQARRPGDGQGAAGGPRRGPDARLPPSPSASRSRRCWPSAAATTSPTRAGRRSTRPSARPASRTAARA